MVTLPYVKGVTGPIQRILRRHEIATSVRPYQNIKRILVHPQDKVEDSKKTDCVYKSLVRALTTHISAKQGEH